MDQTQFSTLAKHFFSTLLSILEANDAEGDLEIDIMDNILSITLLNGMQYIINQHYPSQQLWLSSPFSGAYHFSYDENNLWKTREGILLDDILLRELTEHTGITFHTDSL